MADPIAKVDESYPATRLALMDGRFKGIENETGMLLLGG
jgi:hypothetical protein